MAVPFSGELIEGFCRGGVQYIARMVSLMIARAAVSITFCEWFLKSHVKESPADEVTQKPGTT